MFVIVLVASFFTLSYLLIIDLEKYRKPTKNPAAKMANWTSGALIGELRNIVTKSHPISPSPAGAFLDKKYIARASPQNR
jgi:hypothetical protein